MEALLASLPGGQTLRCANYGAAMEHEEISFEGILTGQGIQGLQSSSMSQHWNGEGSIGSSSSPLSGKRFHIDHTGGAGSADQIMDGNNNSFVSLLNQLPQSSGTFHQNTLMGSLSDGTYRQTYHLPSLNWNS